MINISYEGNAKPKSESTNRMSIIKKTGITVGGDKAEALGTAWWAQNDLTVKMASVSHKGKGSTDPAVPLLLKVLRTRSHKTSYLNVHGSLVNSQDAETACQLTNR